MMKAAVFDLDGTLINSLIFWKEFWRTVGEKYLQNPNFHPGEEVDRECRTLPLAGAMELAWRCCGVGANGEELTELASEMILTLYRDRVETKPGVVEYLRYLKERGVKMVVATASDGELVEYAMNRCGLYEFFSEVISCEAVGKGKEHPDIFLLALERLGTAAEDTWMFEDSYVSLRTARSVGMRTVGIYDPNNYGQELLRACADHYIAEGEQLTRLIGVL